MAPLFERVISWCVSAPSASMPARAPVGIRLRLSAGITHVATLVAHVEDPRSSLPESARLVLKLLVDTFTALEGQIVELDGEIDRRSKADPTARRLMTIPGVGKATT
jgi:transposase